MGTHSGLCRTFRSPNPITGIALEEIHGQVGLMITLSYPMTITFTDGTNKTLTTLGVQLGAVKDSANNAVYSLAGNFVRAGWNYFLVEGDQSKGLHNPTFVQTVLGNTLAKDLSN